MSALPKSMSDTLSTRVRIAGLKSDQQRKELREVFAVLPGVLSMKISCCGSSLVIEHTADVTPETAWPPFIDALGLECLGVGEAEVTPEPAPAADALSLKVTGMRCGGCASGLQKKLAQVAGVAEVAVNYALEEVRAVPDAEASDGFKPRLVSAIEAAGYQVVDEAPLASEPSTSESEATPANAPAQSAPQPWWTEGRLLLLAAALSLPLAAPMLSSWLIGSWDLPHVWAWVLATPVQFFIGARFYRGAWQSLRNGAANMDVLVVLGTTAAYGYSVYSLLANGASGTVYFESAAVVMTLVLLGKWLESRAKSKASDALQSLLALRPQQALVLRDGSETLTPIAQVRVGDAVVVRPGDTVPVDGVVTQGESEVDESLLSGESLPCVRTVDDKVVSGTRNLNGRLQLKVTAVGDDSTIAQIANIVAQAQMGQAPIQRTVDRISAWFVPVVVLIALATLAGWLWQGASAETALLNAVAVLVIACPCALGLATPTALVAGTGVAASQGILVKDIQSLERAAQVDAVVFDKTGTLTEGQPQLLAIMAVDGNENGLLEQAASLQLGSEHPLGKALVTAAKARGLNLVPPTQSRALVGQGIEGRVGEAQWVLGHEDFLRSQNIELPETLQSPEAGTLILAARDGQFVGGFMLQDALREDSAEAIRQLNQRGIKTYLFSGDREAEVARVAKALNVSTYAAQMLPQDKAERVRKLKKSGHHVAMVGDGINDAPALAEASVGVAMGSGTDVAVDSADLVLLKNHPKRLLAGLDIAKRTARKVHQNLFWAFIYNVIALPLAVMGWLDPMVAGAAMAFSSVSVVLNALTLRRWRAPQ